MAVALNHAAIERARKLAGCNAIATSKGSMPNNEICSTYRKP